MDFDFSQATLIRLNESVELNSFDCGDSDLNEFLYADSRDFQKKRLAVTYLLMKDDNLVAFFSVLNDKISINEIKNPNIFDDFKSIFPVGKKLSSYPAVKIGRLGVDKKYQGKKIGEKLINYTIKLFCTNNRTGCGFITVDAYRQSLNFYEKMGFVYLTNRDLNRDTRLMYFNLSSVDD